MPQERIPAAGDPRPDPEALLLRAKEEAKRARLRIFFGFAPGVGKTYRMLQVARELVEQEVDVAVGLVETHGRYETAALLLGMPLLPRRKFAYRGSVLEELDVDGVLTRKPRVVLVDELAHTNAPGSRHQKRWQDVMELLDAGIDVYTTLNVQHLESLNDVVAQITGVRVRETVPDAVLERADEVELVDLAPEELLVRLKEGKVYIAAQAERAATHFFRRGNLLALRELALRQVAEHVDDDVLEYREAHGVDATWATSERILVCVGPAPASARLVRAVRRMATRLRGPWVAAYVEVSGRAPLAEADRVRLEAHLALAESLGATIVRLDGLGVGDAVLAYARKHNVTRIVLGKPTHARIWDRLRGSLLDELVRGSGNIDVHVISGDDEKAVAPTVSRAAVGPFEPRPYLLASGLVALMTAVGWGLREAFHVPDVEMLYLVAVMFAALRLGRGPSIFVAGLSVATYDFFFVPPYYTLAVRDGRYLLTFTMMFGLGFVMSALATRVQRQERAARSREERTRALYALSRELGGSQAEPEVAEAAARQASEAFAVPAVIVGEDGAETAWPRGAALQGSEHAVCKWAKEHRTLAGLGTATLPGAKVLCAPLVVGNHVLGVLALRPEAALPHEQRTFLETFARQIAFALERVRLTEQARQAAIKAKTEELRSSLLSSVSHDLRTPLAVLTGTASTLRDEARASGATERPTLSPQTQRELLDTMVEEAERLERLVKNLLDMTRLEGGELALKREWVPLVEVVGSALSHLEHLLGDRVVHTHLPDDLPLVSVDPVLLEQLFINLLENAIKYTPESSPLTIRARVESATLVVELADQGPGIAEGDEERIFERFYRGAHQGKSSAGLGLAICRAIAEAHGGTLTARNDGGAVFEFRLPLQGTPPTVEA